MRGRTITALLTAVILLSAAGCGNVDDTNSASAPAQSSSASAQATGAVTVHVTPVATPAPTSGQSESTDEEENMTITITVAGRTISARLYDNAAAHQLYESLPVTYPMMNLYGREMCYRMGRGALPTDEAADTGYEIGDISYWPPAGSLVILYKQNGEVFEQQPIGHTDDDLSFLDGLPDTDVTFERSK